MNVLAGEKSSPTTRRVGERAPKQEEEVDGWFSNKISTGFLSEKKQNLGFRIDNKM